MKDRIRSLPGDHIYELVKLLKDIKDLKNQWNCRVKHKKNSSRPRYKARLVVEGFG